MACNRYLSSLCHWLNVVANNQSISEGNFGAIARHFLLHQVTFVLITVVVLYLVV